MQDWHTNMHMHAHKHASMRAHAHINRYGGIPSGGANHCATVAMLVHLNENCI